jgi:hypothetical protein
MRKFLLSFIALASISANAQTTFEKSNTTYTVTGANTVELTSGDKTALKVDVPSTVSNNGVTYTVTAIADEAYYWGKAAEVTIPGTVKRIGESILLLRCNKPYAERGHRGDSPLCLRQQQVCKS